jgi:phosphate transport system ATP-binding protein
MSATMPKLRVQGLSAWYGERRVLDGISLLVPSSRITAIIGPSGCGKTTFIRCINRMHERVAQVRRRVGMVFHRPNPFPTMSIGDNVLAGLRLTATRAPEGDEAAMEQALRAVSLWDEVRDRLARRADTLSAGQQQRLCIARALAVQPDVLLMDEPCASLDTDVMFTAPRDRRTEDYITGKFG